MPPKNKTKPSVSSTRLSRRDEIRAERQRKENRKKLLIIGGIVLVVVVIALLVVLPSIRGIQNQSVQLPPEGAYPSATRNTLGDPTAKVKVEEFFDYNCIHCQDFALGQEGEIIEKYVKTGKVYYESNPFPFMAATSFTAANAAECAADQNKYWEYKKTVFLNEKGGYPQPLADSSLRAYAESLKLNMTDFDSCYSSNKYNDEIQKRLDYGSSQGVNGTPSFLVNGKLVSANEVQSAIEEALAN